MSSAVAMVRKLGENVVKTYSVKAEVLAARADGLRNVFRLGRSHHEDHVIRRLFQRFKQRIESRIGDLVGFVEDVDLVAIPCRRVPGSITELSNFIDTAVRGGVNLDHVDGISCSYFGAGIADAAGLGRRALLRPDGCSTIQSHGQKSSDGRLADAAMPAENIAVSDTALAQRVHHRASDVVLPGNVCEALGAIFAS